VARRVAGPDLSLYAELVEVLVETSLGMATREAIDLAAYHLDLAPGDEPGLAAWRPVLRAARCVLDADPSRALAHLDARSDWPSDAHRRAGLVVGILAASALGDRAEQRRRVAAAARWVREHRGRDARSQLSSWTGWLRFEAGRHAVAAGLHARAARLARRPRTRTTSWINAAIAALEAGELDRAAEWARLAVEHAARSRDVVNEARAERVLRQAAYRSGAALAVDEELLDAAASLPRSVTRGLLRLGEAAIAWRTRRLALASSLAEEAAADLAASREAAGAVLARALAAVAACRGEAGLAAALAAVCRSGAPRGVVAQATALVGRAAGWTALPPELVELSMEWSRSSDRADERREVLSPFEVGNWLGRQDGGGIERGGSA
jgi:hypothetical protein